MFSLVTDADYREKIAATGSGLLFCSKKLCPYCRQMELYLQRFARELPNIEYLRLDAQKDHRAALDLGINRTPTLLRIEKGQILARKTGLLNCSQIAEFYHAV